MMGTNILTHDTVDRGLPSQENKLFKKIPFPGFGNDMPYKVLQKGKRKNTLRYIFNRIRLKRYGSITISRPDSTYRVSYLGNVVTGWAKGDGCVEKPLTTLWRNYTQSSRPDVSMQLTISGGSLKVVTKTHGLTEYWAHRLTTCAAPPEFPRIFCWIYRHEGRRLRHELRCHAVLCSSSELAAKIDKELKESLALALAEFKKEKLCKQNARLSLVNSVYENPSMPRRKILLNTGSQNYRPPLERSKSAPKLSSIEEILEEEDIFKSSRQIYKEILKYYDCANIFDYHNKHITKNNTNRSPLKEKNSQRHSVSFSDQEIKEILLETKEDDLETLTDNSLATDESNTDNTSYEDERFDESLEDASTNDSDSIRDPNEADKRTELDFKIGGTVLPTVKSLEKLQTIDLKVVGPYVNKCLLGQEEVSLIPVGETETDFSSLKVYKKRSMSECGKDLLMYSIFHSSDVAQNEKDDEARSTSSESSLYEDDLSSKIDHIVMVHSVTFSDQEILLETKEADLETLTDNSLATDESNTDNTSYEDERFDESLEDASTNDSDSIRDPNEADKRTELDFKIGGTVLPTVKSLEKLQTIDLKVVGPYVNKCLFMSECGKDLLMYSIFHSSDVAQNEKDDEARSTSSESSLYEDDLSSRIDNIVMKKNSQRHSVTFSDQEILLETKEDNLETLTDNSLATDEFNTDNTSYEDERFDESLEDATTNDSDSIRDSNEADKRTELDFKIGGTVLPTVKSLEKVQTIDLKVVGPYVNKCLLGQEEVSLIPVGETETDFSSLKVYKKRSMSECGKDLLMYSIFHSSDVAQNEKTTRLGVRVVSPVCTRMIFLVKYDQEILLETKEDNLETLTDNSLATDEFNTDNTSYEDERFDESLEDASTNDSDSIRDPNEADKRTEKLGKTANYRFESGGSLYKQVLVRIRRGILIPVGETETNFSSLKVYKIRSISECGKDLLMDTIFHSSDVAQNDKDDEARSTSSESSLYEDDLSSRIDNIVMV
ncbi:uncharacterized protein LOC115876554 [Sitophilus oryzae]|uniref:Uncharacterized protein LOC115876554 n=1 Tax=Sitophilus oryzae TaxID=7048 RepID=A0A6J2XBP7_SITOR|nr:uncharacterized protein LOC115876554 [Sitophilus oryzae]